MLSVALPSFSSSSPPAPDSAGGAPWPSATGLLAAGDLLSAPPGGHRRGQHRGQGEGSRHLQQAASAAATDGRRPAHAAGKTTGTSALTAPRP